MGIHSYTYQTQLLLLHSATPARQSERQMPPSPTCSLCCLWISPTNSAFPENTVWIIQCRHLRVAGWGHTTWICSITKTNSSSPSSWLREACPHSAASALLNAEQHLLSSKAWQVQRQNIFICETLSSSLPIKSPHVFVAHPTTQYPQGLPALRGDSCEAILTTNLSTGKMDLASEWNTATTCSTCPCGDWAENSSMQISNLRAVGIWTWQVRSYSALKPLDMYRGAKHKHHLHLVTSASQPPQ